MLPAISSVSNLMEKSVKHLYPLQHRYHPQIRIQAKPKALQAGWKKVSGASGYQVWYSASKKFKKKSVKITKKTKLTVKKLKSGKDYFVKVRAYTVKKGKKVYGAWSKTVKKKVK